MIQNSAIKPLETATDRWFVEFSLLIIITGLASGIAYLSQEWYFKNNQFQNDLIIFHLVRAIRMAIFYVFFPLLLNNHFFSSGIPVNLITIKRPQ